MPLFDAANAALNNSKTILNKNQSGNSIEYPQNLSYTGVIHHRRFLHKLLKLFYSFIESGMLK